MKMLAAKKERKKKSFCCQELSRWKRKKKNEDECLSVATRVCFCVYARGYMAHLEGNN